METKVIFQISKNDPLRARRCGGLGGQRSPARPINPLKSAIGLTATKVSGTVLNRRNSSNRLEFEMTADKSVMTLLLASVSIVKSL